MRTEFMKANTKLPQYISFPCFLLELKLSFLSMLIYALLLNRATLSAKNGWMNAEGSIYVYYPIASLAEAVGRKESVVKDALRTLRKNNLIETLVEGQSRASKIFIKIPSGVEDGFSPNTKTEKRRYKGQKSTFQYAEKSPPNNINELHNFNSIKEYNESFFGEVDDV